MWRHRFDFEIGYLIKSPCRQCELRSALPRCAKTCALLERIQDRLSETVSCSRR